MGRAASQTVSAQCRVDEQTVICPVGRARPTARPTCFRAVDQRTHVVVGGGGGVPSVCSLELVSHRPLARADLLSLSRSYKLIGKKNVWRRRLASQLSAPRPGTKSDQPVAATATTRADETGFDVRRWRSVWMSRSPAPSPTSTTVELAAGELARIRGVRRRKSIKDTRQPDSVQASKSRFPHSTPFFARAAFSKRTSAARRRTTKGIWRLKALRLYYTTLEAAFLSPRSVLAVKRGIDRPINGSRPASVTIAVAPP
uniref:Uncharacterized protein n=1 Tax=Plectus sambesii TaxID=2011161 RepID=A0A914UPL9_9BILA